MIQVQTVSGTIGPAKVDTYAFQPAERSVFVGPEDDCPARVLVVIPVVNLWGQYTRPCLDSVFGQELPEDVSFEVQVIDNGSVDETETEIRKYPHKIHYERHQENWGVAKSWNWGIEGAFCKPFTNKQVGLPKIFDYVFVINNDVLLHKRCIARLVERFQKKEGDLVLAGALDIRGECVVPEDIFQKDDKGKEGLAESEHPNFSGFMVNKKCLDEVGEFDEGFYPAFFEDNDYHYRIKLAGLRAVCYPPALFYHYGSRTQNDPRHVSGLVNAEKFEGCRRYYVEKWGGPPRAEQFDRPFNDKSKSLKWTKQSEKTKK